MELQIAATASIIGRRAFFGHTLYYEQDTDDFDAFAKGLYNELGMKYLKFFKMDHLSKQGILAAEILLQDIASERRPASDRIGIVLGGQFSSLETDQRFYESYAVSPDGIPSPGLFVYTLPNILIGELCIRHKITGEHGCFVTHPTQLECLYLYVRNLFMQGRVDGCLIAWNDYYDTENRCTIAWVEKSLQRQNDRIFDLSWCQRMVEFSLTD